MTADRSAWRLDVYQIGRIETLHCNIRTASHERALEWETPAKEFCVGQFVDRARRMFKNIALEGHSGKFTSVLGSAVVPGKSSTRDRGDEDGQSWNEGEKPHSVCLGTKERGVKESVGL